MANRKVLVTGATGYIASRLLPGLQGRYDLTLVDVRATRGDGTPIAGVQVANLLEDDDETLRPFFRGQDAIVHLAFNRSPDAAMSTSQRATRLTPGSAYEAERANVDMAYRVFQLALEENVRRVVVASSNHAADWYEHLIHDGKMDVVLPSTYPKSDNWYGWAKATYEHLGFVFATGTLGRKVENVHLRIGAPREINADQFADDPKGYKRDLGAYLSARDLQQLTIKSIETERIEDEHGIPWQVFYGISGNTRAFWSLVNARTVIGYAPEDDSEVLFASDIQRLLRDKPGRT
ncbi:MAG: NAD(P)-dependent oxidoreductase [Chloroflexota bacterium]|nr:NAD(P)-dependent oxidoreductase [Chloroflexota bacterium]MDQ6908594.1 NAD(P)-dependent oxidoreductase [Chloroflexota bacterium]